MQIKRFYAVSFPAAIRDVRRMLGPDAVILATRSLSVEDARSLVNIPNAKVEVTAALETPESGPPAPGQTRSPAGLARAKSDRLSRPTPSAPSIRPNDETGRIPQGMQEILRDLRALSAELAAPAGRSAVSTREGAGGMPAARNAPSASSTGLTLSAPPTSSLPPNAIRDATIRWYAAAAEGYADSPLSASRLLGCLREHGVDEALTQRIIGRMYCAARRVEARPWHPGNIVSVDENTESTFGRFVRVVGDFLAPYGPEKKPGSGPRHLALAGPTGVGKTTTIAKIAAHHTLRKSENVALITLDTYRIAAVEQLKTYARLLGVPIEVVSDYGRFGQALERFREADLVLIDTPGYSPNDRPAIERLGAALSGCPETETHLVIPAGLRLAEMRRSLEAFRPVGFRRTIFSKIDEAVARGDLLNAWILDGLEVSYFTMGQRVPEDLAPASLEWLCRTLLTAEPARAAS